MSAPPEAPGPGAGTESAAPDAPGPGSGTAAAGTALTGAAQTAANATFDGLQGFGNYVYDIGESGLLDALKVVDAAQTGISNVGSIVTAKITGGTPAALPTIPTADIAGTLTGEAQTAANKLLNGVQTLVNEVYNLGEEGLAEALTVVDKAQVELTSLYSHITSLLAKKLGPPKG